MDAFEIGDVEAQRVAAGRLYEEFLRVDSMSAGLYVLEAGATDPQSPHAEDEIYYVISGRGQVQVAGEHRAVGAGSVIFVGKGVDHRFHSIEQRLDLLVLFAPAESES
jgi:mannose-6-phosphate isomerase-like protein (cupin superfamily)